MVKEFFTGRVSDALEIPKGVCALIGGGGKTTLMLRLGQELSEYARVMLTTTTHILKPEGIPLMSAQEAARARQSLICVAAPGAEGKLQTPNGGVEGLSALAEYVIAEADGARGRPLKAHAAHEPVIPENAALIVYVVGADGIGEPIARAAHRPELYAALIGADTAHTVTPGDAALAVTLMLKRLRSSARKLVLINKADSAGRLANARLMAAELDCDTYITALKGD